MKFFIFILLLFFVVAAGKTYGYEKALQEQAGKTNWPAAERILHRAERQCIERSDSERCREKINFSRAWTYSQKAAQDSQNREGYLQLARDGYLDILQRHPKHLATLDNLLLVLEELGDHKELENLLRSLKELKENKRDGKRYDKRYGNAALILASLYSERGEYKKAFAYYGRAYEVEPSQRALRGLINIYTKAIDGDKAKRIEALAKRSRNFSMQRQLWEAILHSRNTQNSADQGRWERAAINWVALLGKERMLSAQLIEKDVALLVHPEFQELAKRLREPYLGLSPGDVKIGEMILLDYRRMGWWNDSLLRTWAFAIAAWSQGHNRLLNNDIEAANRIWSAALQFAPPTYDYESMELRGRWAVSLELLTDLARLQRVYQPEIDPRGNTFARIEQALFNSKSQAYRVKDLKAIQRHHTLMGKMYADFGVFSEQKSGVRSAEFQLRHAIKTAERRSAVTGKPDPQPQLTKLMADGYSCRLPSQSTSCKSKPDKAQKLYLKATKGYLKLDAVQPAKKTLQNINRTTPKAQKKVKQLETMIDLRKSLSDDSLKKGKDHPDVVTKKVDIANQWQKMGETDKAQDTLDRVISQERKTIDSTIIYKQLEKGKIEEIKEKALQMQRIKKESD